MYVLILLGSPGISFHDLCCWFYQTIWVSSTVILFKTYCLKATDHHHMINCILQEHRFDRKKFTHTDYPWEYLNHIELFVFSPQKNLCTRIAQSYRLLAVIFYPHPPSRLLPLHRVKGRSPPCPRRLRPLQHFKMWGSWRYAQMMAMGTDVSSSKTALSCIFHIAFAVAIIQLETHLFPERHFKQNCFLQVTNFKQTATRKVWKLKGKSSSHIMSQFVCRIIFDGYVMESYIPAFLFNMVWHGISYILIVKSCCGPFRPRRIGCANFIKF